MSVLVKWTRSGVYCGEASNDAIDSKIELTNCNRDAKESEKMTISVVDARELLVNLQRALKDMGFAS